MSSSDFRQIAIKTEAGKAERLFRAAVSAFCALTRPSRREIAQLDDLTLPLFDDVPPDALRFAATALAECESAPPGLVKRLADMPVEISGPLLIRSRALSDVHIIALIGRHGLPHARALARRKGLHPTIASLVRALDRPVPVPGEQPASGSDPRAETGSAAERTRERLRTMMGGGDLDATSVAPATPPTISRLLEAALETGPARLQAVLAEALGLEAERTRRIVSPSDYFSLLIALRALRLREPEAFLIVSAACPGSFPDVGGIRLFLERYRNLDPQAAAARVATWAEPGKARPRPGASGRKAG